MKFYVYRLMLKATVIGRTAGLRCDSTLPPQPLCHGRPWLATLGACCDPSGCQDARASTIKPLPNAMSAPLSVRSCDG
jgi:hypothetical protein